MYIAEENRGDTEAMAECFAENAIVRDEEQTIGRRHRSYCLTIGGDDDQIVPIADSAMLSSKIVKNAKLVVYKGAPHGMCTTLKDKANEELLAFIET